LKFSISPVALRNFATRNGLTIEYSCLYTPPGIRIFIEKYLFINIIWGVIRQTVSLLSLGRVDVGLTEYILVLRK
jgi:hypothetical protein